VQGVDARRLPHRPLHAVGELAVGLVAEPLRAPGRLLLQQRLEVHRRRRAVRLRGPDGGGAACRRLQPEPHHRFVDRADVLDVQGAVGDPLAAQDDQLLQHAVDGAVGDERRLDPLVDLAGAALGAALQEAVAVGVEQGAAARRQAHAAGAGAVVDHAEQRQQLRPGAEALVHRVGVQRGVRAQPFVQAGQRVVGAERLVGRQQVPLFGVEQEDEPQDDGEQGAVHGVRVVRQDFPQQRAAAGVVRGLQPAQQLVEGVQHLFGQPFAHRVLPGAAVGEEGGQPLPAGEREQALLAEQQTERRAERAAGGGEQVGRVEVHPAGALAARGGDEAERDAVEEQAGGTPGTAEQAFGTALGRGFEAAQAGADGSGAAATGGGRAGGGDGRRVEILPRFELLHEKLPRRPAVPRVALADREIGPEHLAVVRERNLQLRRNRGLLGAGVPQGREAPAEDGGGEPPEVRDTGLRAARRVDLPFVDAAEQAAPPLYVLPVQDRPCLRERRSGDHEALRLEEAEPFEVGAGVGVGGGHGINPAGRRRRGFPSEAALCVRW